MRKAIAIGESILDTVFLDDRPTDSFVGGRIANAAASVGESGIPVEMVSECCNDHIGDIITGFLHRHHVGTGSVDRFTDGSTAASMIFHSSTDGGKKLVNFYNYPDDRFDVVWPRIDEDDVILFGSFYSIDIAMRETLLRTCEIRPRAQGYSHIFTRMPTWNKLPHHQGYARHPGKP